MSKIDHCVLGTRLWATASALALGTAILTAPPAAAQSCGTDQPGADSVSCPAGTYGSGINYAGSDGLTVNLNNSGIIVQGTGVQVTGSNINANDIVVNAVNFGSVASSSQGIAAVNAGTGGAATATMDGGSVTTTGNQHQGLLANNSGTSSPGLASATLNGGGITTSGILSYGVQAQSNSTNASAGASVTMTGGSIQTSGQNAAGINATMLNTGSTGGASVFMSGGSITTTGPTARGIVSLTQGTGTALVRMSGGVIQTGGTNADGIYATSQSGHYDVGVSGGSVTGGGGTGAAIHLDAAAGGTLAIGSGATINAGASGVAISQTGGLINLTTGGTINGAVNLAAVANTLTVTGGSITGDVTGGGSTALNVNAPGGSFTYGADHAMSGLAGVTMTAGAAEIRGAVSTTGALTVNGGALATDGGNLTSANTSVSGGSLQIENGGRLNTALITDISGNATLVVDGVGSALTTDTFKAGSLAGTTTILIQNGGTAHATSTSNSGISWGNTTGAQVNVTVTGLGSRLDIDHLLPIAGSAGASASVLVADGAAMTASRINLGAPSAAQIAPPTLQVDGPGSSLTLSGALAIYKGSVSVTGGGSLATPTASMAGVNGNANLLVSGAGSNFTTTGALTIGMANNGTAVVTLADQGRLSAGGIAMSTAATRTGVLNIGGAEGAAATGAGVLDAPTLTFGAGTGRLNFNHTDTNYTFAAAISGSGAINQVSGVTLLTGDSSGFTGVTTVSGGELHVNGILGASGGPVQVRTGGVLGGSGTITGGVTVADGVLAPGNSPGTLTITGDLALVSTSRLSMQFGQAGVAGGPLDDLVKVGGALTLDGTLDVATSPGGSFDPGVYRIVAYDGALTDNGLTLGSTPGGSRLALQTAIAGQVNLINFTGVPVDFWDGDGPGRAANGVVEGGSGVWTRAGTNWTIDTGDANAAYDPSALAIFAAAPGAVTVSGPVSASGMQFAVDGYHLSGDEIALTGGASSTIRVGDGSAAGAAYTAQIDDVLSGATTLTKTDLGTLVLTAANTFTGGAVIAAGALQLGAGGTSGSINGDVADNGVLAFDRSDAVTFAGAISGTGAVSQIGPGTTTLSGGNTYSGGTTISAGALKGSAASFGSGAIRDDAALILDQPSDATMANAIDGSGTLTKAGIGKLTLTGTGSLTGPTTVAGGALSLNGALAASAFTVMSGATLKGFGTVGAATIQAGGTVAPGNSIGVLHVDGAFVQAAGSSYQVEIDPTSSLSDQIAAAGAATLQPGANLIALKGAAGNYHPGAVYTVLSAAGGVDGTYGFGLQPVSAFLALKDSYDASHAYLTVVQTADPSSITDTSNEGAVAGGLPGSGGLTDAVLNTQTESDARRALDQLAGDGHAATKGVLVSDSRLVRDLAIGRVQTLFCGAAGLVGGRSDAGCPEDARPAAWGQVFDTWGRTDGDGNAGEANRSTGGFLIGADAPLAGSRRAGGFAGYSHTRLTLDGGSADGDIDSYHLGLYGGAQYGALGLRLGGAYAFHQLHSSRSVLLPSLAEQLEAGYDANTAQGFAQIGYGLDVGAASLEPFVETAYVAAHTNGFTERGGVAALAARPDDTDAVFSTLGFKPALPLAFGQVKASLHGLFGWRHDYGDIAPSSTVRFVAGGSPFTVTGAPLARDAGVVELGLDMKADNAALGLTYGARGWTHDFDQTVRVDLRVAF